MTQGKNLSQRFYVNLYKTCIFPTKILKPEIGFKAFCVIVEHSLQLHQ